MGKNRGFNYYNAYVKQADYAYELVCNLESALRSGDFGTRELMEAMHTVENDADQVCHEVHEHLLTDFVVPFERNSMTMLTSALDDVNDVAEDVAIRAYYFHCTDFEPVAGDMFLLAIKAVEELKAAVSLLSAHSKQSDAIKRHLVAAQGMESECDRVYIEAVHELYGREGEDPERRRIAHSMLSAIEKVLDTVEDAAEQVEALIVENA